MLLDHGLCLYGDRSYLGSLKKRLLPRTYELALMFFGLMVCFLQVAAYRILSKFAVGDIHVIHEMEHPRGSTRMNTDFASKPNIMSIDLD